MFSQVSCLSVCPQGGIPVFGPRSLLQPLVPCPLLVWRGTPSSVQSPAPGPAGAGVPQSGQWIAGGRTLVVTEEDFLILINHDIWTEPFASFSLLVNLVSLE